MSDINAPRDSTPQAGIPEAAALATERSWCATTRRRVDEQLRERCGRKANLLACRCSGCDGDDRFPVLLSPGEAYLLNTAADGKGGRIPSGTDLHWEVGQGKATGGIGSVGTWSPATIVANPDPLWATSPLGNAGWISNSLVRGDNLFYRVRFNLASSVNPSTFVLDLAFYADNQVVEIWVNGVPQSSQPNGAGKLPGASTSAFQEGKQLKIRLDNSWQQCGNTIVVHVRSPEGPAGLMVQNTGRSAVQEARCDCRCRCTEAPIPDIRPCITVAWGDTRCDCMETDDVEVLCITVCNCYSNVTFGGLTIGQVVVTDLNGGPVPALPDGTPSVQVVPVGPICFGDITPCVDGDRPSCVSREVVLRTRGAAGKRYRLSLDAICFSVCLHYEQGRCFTFNLCQD
jgi:hypothetical protein